MALDDHDILDMLGSTELPSAEQFKELVAQVDHRVLAKVLVLSGPAFVFRSNPMKYMVFKEQVADQFGIGSHDVCIVGSAKLGFSRSQHKFGTPFDVASDVDVVVIADALFNEGSLELFKVLNSLDPSVGTVRPHVRGEAGSATPPVVALADWMKVQEALRNFTYRNFNPGLLPFGNHFREEFFDAISSTAGLFLALEPKVVVSRIRGRVFRDWKAAEDYYANSLRELRQSGAAGNWSVEDAGDPDDR